MIVNQAYTVRHHTVNRLIALVMNGIRQCDSIACCPNSGRTNAFDCQIWPCFGRYGNSCGRDIVIFLPGFIGNGRKSIGLNNQEIVAYSGFRRHTDIHLRLIVTS